jgi:hypothetical protein
MMRKGLFRLLGAAALLATATAASTGCGTDGGGKGTGTGGQSSGAGGQTSGTGGVSTGGSGGSGGTGSPVNCNNASPCGGNVVGTWNVASSCLRLSGDMDMSLTSLDCATVPVSGSLQATGTITFNANGTYADGTTTTGSVTFPLDATCLSISSVAVGCDRIGNIFMATGWTTANCSEPNGQCGCSLSTVQQGGLGAVVSYTEPMSSYTTAGNTLTAANVTYQYCAQGDTLTLTPQMSALTGTIVLQREGTGGTGGMGGMSGTGTGGMSGTDAGGMSGAGAGGMSSGMGGMSGGAGGRGGAGSGGRGGAGAGGSAGTAGAAGTGGTKPCDIYAAGNTPCVAAHSTIRALFGAYSGNLYQVKRADGMTRDIPVKSAGGFADSAQQDSFCMGTTCTIWRVYDQSGHGNFIEAETPDSSVGGFRGQTAASATAEALTVGGNRVYSLYTRPNQAYWRDGSQSGMPLGAEPQGVYMVTSGTHYNGGCCYNYGNAQTSRIYEGGPTMDSVYFGNCTIWGRGAGSGPWVMADMEDGIVSGANTGTNNNSPSMAYRFVTAMEKNNGRTEYALRGANAATMGPLTTMYKGALPAGKNPMRKEGAIVLGSGGDCCLMNNNLSEGTFYEGAIVAGYPSDATDDQVHANIVSAGYGQ